MTVETDYHNGKIIVKRGDDIIYTFEFVDFAPASKIKDINVIKQKIRNVYKNPDAKQEELDILEKEYFVKMMSIAVKNPISYEEAIDKFTLPEVNGITEEALIFLVNWSTMEAVKQYASSQVKVQTAKNEPNKSLDTQS